ncbi:hypothetical protein GCM10007301_27360 [Azorhizobium oxalatiphilum]|uniref:Uncharacterized protein n=1 Tax=Azorhizobium oxalatiphilum TaxID=980631 RepID=A0A917FB06_9HYPH|nr:hypothetical protein GCM10007301_27360 [Azorhizobium oxalatiphilum]
MIPTAPRIAMAANATSNPRRLETLIARFNLSSAVLSWRSRLPCRPLSLSGAAARGGVRREGGVKDRGEETRPDPALVNRDG